MRILVTVAFVAVSLGAHAVSAQTISEVTVSDEDIAKAQQLVEAIKDHKEADKAAHYRAAKALTETDVGREQMAECRYRNEDRMWAFCMFDDNWEFDSAFDSLYDEFYTEELSRIMNKTSEEEGAQ